MHTCLVALGSNLGDSSELLRKSAQQLDEHPQIQLGRCSRWYRTLPFGGPPGQAEYLNGAAQLRTNLPPHGLLDVVQRCEIALGRTRSERWAARTIDLDLLLVDDFVLDTPTLVLPHPHMSYRQFVLKPAAEVAPEMVHPKTGWTVHQLYENAQRKPSYVALAGLTGVDKTTLAQAVCRRLSCRMITEPVDENPESECRSSPFRRAWKAESDLLQRRAELLKVAYFMNEDQILISDFWFDQSVAFASRWFNEDQLGAYRWQWTALKENIIKPNLVVLLYATPEQRLSRTKRRDRLDEGVFTKESLDHLHGVLENQTSQSGVGPVTHIDVDSTDAADQITVAVKALFSPCIDDGS